MDFKQAKQKKERGYSVVELIDELNEVKGKYAEMMVIAITEEGSIDLSLSVDNDATAIGYLDILKQNLLDEITGR